MYASEKHFVEVNKMVTAEVLRPAGAAQSKGLGCCPTSSCKARGLCIDKDIACYNGVGSEKFTASELYRCPNLSYNEDVLRERSIA